MTSPILFGFLQYIFGPLLLVTSVFLILVVLVQRGRGGGLTGALGGAGGQSAFGAKAGDVFTKITVVVAVFWILLCIFATMGLQDQGASKLTGGGGSAAPAATGLPGDTTPGAGGPALTLPSDEEKAAPAAGDTPAADAPAADLEPPAEGGAAAPAADAAPAAGDASSTEEKPAE
ncbi:preprotein translocase subunit SecG [Bremerella volcania]|uniref:Protein-export membrane protein SecG n=1 Tax=Bremerella volcania TaxID=2527984 RepID=A0A518CB99_9BACT|nr:preprotein translocase subunit SecG [Bremerella volcania]QDU76503.1 preprotein translocase subunit SecG [Bremerella volcania]